MLLFVLVSITSCGSNGTPSGILKPDKMQAVLWDVIRADAFTADFIKRDSAKNAVEENLKLQQQIFAIHHISKDVFYKSYDYYKTHTPLLRVMLDSMIIQAGRNKDYRTKPLKQVE
jgi:Domain of unknown function (DUF4296)